MGEEIMEGQIDTTGQDPDPTPAEAVKALAPPKKSGMKSGKKVAKAADGLEPADASGPEPVVSPEVSATKAGVKEDVKLDVLVEEKVGKESPVVKKSEEEKLAFAMFKTQPAIVSVRMGTTLNLGNYRSARIEIGISYPCYAEQVDQTYAYARNFVESRVEAEAKSVLAAEGKAAEADKASAAAFAEPKPATEAPLKGVSAPWKNAPEKQTWAAPAKPAMQKKDTFDF